jgi:phosphatidylglycerol lysyltransferase
MVSEIIPESRATSVGISRCGMQQRSRWAWALSAVLLGAGAFSLMLKGFAWEKAITLVLLLLALLPARQEFRHETLPSSEQHASGWLVAIAVVFTADGRLNCGSVLNAL